MSQEKFAQRVAEHLHDFFSDEIVKAMRPVIEAQDKALMVARKIAGPESEEALDALEEALSAARDLFEIDTKEIQREVLSAVEEEQDSSGLVEEDEVERQVAEAREAPEAFLELLGISEQEQALAENLDTIGKLERWLRYVPSFRAKILQLATRVCDEDDASAARPAYVFRGGHDTTPGSDARSAGWHSNAVAALNPKKAKKTRGAK